jgi:hypothetical protein
VSSCLKRALASECLNKKYFNSNCCYNEPQWSKYGMDSCPKKRKVRLNIACTHDERTYIKLLAAKNKMTISELILTHFRSSFPKKILNIPNDKTIKALQESRKKKLKSYQSRYDFWNAMKIDPNV